MTRKRSTPPADLSHRWYLAEWAALAAKTQADAQRELGWSKASASALWRGNQRYTQDLVDDVARWFGIEPFEVLMRPQDALALRNIRGAARLIAAEESGRPFEGAPANQPPASFRQAG